MHDDDFERILDQLARAKQSSSLLVRQQLQQAMEEALRNPDPEVQKMWASIPRKGLELTLDEFMAYLIRNNQLRP